MLSIEGDRRIHPRSDFDRPCKIYDPRSGDYISGRTCNISLGGLLIEVPRLLALKPGDTLHVGVAAKRRQGLLAAKEMIEAVVVRTMATVDDHTLLAVKFDDSAAGYAQEMRLAA